MGSPHLLVSHQLAQKKRKKLHVPCTVGETMHGATLSKLSECQTCNWIFFKNYSGDLETNKVTLSDKNITGCSIRWSNVSVFTPQPHPGGCYYRLLNQHFFLIPFMSCDTVTPYQFCDRVLANLPWPKKLQSLGSAS